MTAKAKGKLDPKVFDFNSVMAKTKAPEPKCVSVFLRPDLVPRIEELAGLLDAEKGQPAERGVADEDESAAWLAEYNDLVDEFNESELVFEFRAAKFSDNTNAKAAMSRDGIDPEDDDNLRSVSYMLAETAIGVGWSGAEWHQFREKIGEAAFVPLLTTAMSANTGPGVSAPFSRRLSPGRTSETL